MPDKPEIRNIQKLIDFFAWQCPRCLTIVESERKPPEDREWLCNDCQEQAYQEKQEKAKKQIREWMSAWVGCTIISVEPLFDDVWDYNYFDFPDQAIDNTRIHYVVLEKDGQKHRLMSDNLGIYGIPDFHERQNEPS